MITLSNRPPAVMLSGMPAWFAVLNTGDDKRVKATVKDGGTTIASQYAYASVNNIAHFELSEYFDFAMNPKFTFADVPGDIVTSNPDGLIKNLIIEFEDEDSNSFSANICILSGELSPDVISILEYGIKNSNTIADYLNDHPILSLKTPITNIHHPNQPERLFFFAKSSLGSIEVKCLIYFTNGTGSLISIDSFAAEENNLYVIDTSYNAICQPHVSPGLHVASYTVSLHSPSLAETIEYTYQVNFAVKYRGCFFFLNSLGGFDTFAPTGEKSLAYEAKIKHNKIIPSPGAANPVFRFYDRDITEVITQNSGYLSYNQANWLSQMVYSKKAYWKPASGHAIPVGFLSNKIEFIKSRNQLYTAKLKYVVNPEISAEES